MLPLVLGQSIEDSQGVVYIVLTFVFANIAYGGQELRSISVGLTQS